MTTIKEHPIIEAYSNVKFFKVLCELRVVICSFNKQIVEKYLKNNHDKK